MSKYEGMFCMNVELCATHDAVNARKSCGADIATDVMFFERFARDFNLTPIEERAAFPLYVAAFWEAVP
jgi:hypothetical protein